MECYVIKEYHAHDMQYTTLGFSTVLPFWLY